MSAENEFEIVEEEEAPNQVVSNESRSVPALSMVILAVKGKGEAVVNETLMIEPSAKVMKDKGLSVGRLLLPGEGLPSRTQIVNISATPQWIAKVAVLGQIVGVLDVYEAKLDRKADRTSTKIDFDSVKNKDLAPNRRARVNALLRRNLKCFVKYSTELGRSAMVKHRIDTGIHPPVHQPPYKSAFKERTVIQDQVGGTLKSGAVSPSNSPWASAVMLVRKKDGTWRFCIDYRRLNSVTEKDVYPLPRIDDALGCLERSRYFSVMDLQSGYWQVEVNEADRPKTGFITADGLFQFNVMLFGLTNAPGTFQRMMEVMLAGLKWSSCPVYLDDILVFSKTFDEHLIRLEKVLQCISKANLKLKLSK
jgi:hypothetical protein